MDQRETLMHIMNTCPEDQLWITVVLFVGACGQRAGATERPDVEAACVNFIQAMHELVGTPAPPQPTNPPKPVN